MNVFGQLKSACLEILSSAPSGSVQGRLWYNSTTGKNEFDNGTQKRALLANDDKLIVGTSGTANNNTRLHRGAAGVTQLVVGSDVTAEGTLSTALNQVSARQENYTDAGKPAFGNTGRLAYLTDLFTLALDIGSAWKYLVDTNTAQTLTNKTIDFDDNTILNLPTTVVAAQVDSEAATAGQALTADGAGGASWSTPGSQQAFTTQATPYAITANDQNVFLTNSAANTATVPTVVGNSGRKMIIKHVSNNFHAITISPQVGETIGGAASVTLNSWDESIEIVADEANDNWIIVARVIPSRWQEYTPSSSQGFGTLASTDIYRRRVGDSLEFRGKFQMGNDAGTEARMSLIETGETFVASSGISTIEIAGSFTYNKDTEAHFFVLIEPSVSYLTFSYSSSGQHGLDKQTGTGLTGGSNALICSLKGSIPVAEWAA